MGKRLESIINLREEEDEAEGMSLFDLMERLNEG
jgi:hypothetical protein